MAICSREESANQESRLLGRDASVQVDSRKKRPEAVGEENEEAFEWDWKGELDVWEDWQGGF